MLDTCEKKLWQSVVLMAVRDALSKEMNCSKYVAKNIHDAREWLLNNNNHYYQVCNMASIDPVMLREKLKVVIQQ